MAPMLAENRFAGINKFPMRRGPHLKRRKMVLGALKPGIITNDFYFEFWTSGS
jgi:hypothetical protein